MKFDLLIVLFIAIVIAFHVFPLYIPSTQPNQPTTKTYSTTTNDNLVNFGSFDNLFWFVQITDIHITNEKPQVENDFDTLLQHLKNVIKPQFVIVTGDITHSIVGRHSQQQESEWKAYSSLLKKYGYYDKKLWLDVKGNHDNFNVYAYNSPDHYFAKYAVYGNAFAQQRTYEYVYETKFGKYQFIAIDATPQPGPARPYNFFGVLNQTSVEELEWRLKDLKQYNHTIVFGHYPQSVIDFSKSSLRDLSKKYKFVAYLSGHLHTAYGVVRDMKVRVPEGHLELELGDFKVERMYRILAFDHDLLSFVDQKMGEFPVILVTNPKDCRYIHEREPLERMRYSSHVRFLIFSPSPIVNIEVFIDNEKSEEPMEKVENTPLYVMKWNPEKYAKGIHHLRVIASNGEKTVSIEQSFSLDGSNLPQSFFSGFFSRMLLLTNWSYAFRFLTLLLYTMNLILLIFSKKLNVYLKGEKLKTENTFSKVMNIRWWIYKFSQLQQQKLEYKFLLLTCIYMLIGPWLFGHFLNGKYGVVFLWGIVLQDGSIIQSADIYFVYATSFIFFTYTPVLFYFAYSSSSKSLATFLLIYLGGRLLQFRLLIFAYGYSAWISPCGVWFIVISTALIVRHAFSGKKLATE